MDCGNEREVAGEALTDEQALVLEARRGDEAAWRVLFEGHYGRIFSYVRSRVSPREAAEDVAADVFVEAYRSLPRYEWRDRPFGAWLYGIARHRVLMHYRREGRRPPPGVERIANEYLGVELRDVLERLPADYRAAIEYRFVLGLSGEEAAAAMGRSHGAFRALLLRATRAFRTEYERRD